MKTSGWLAGIDDSYIAVSAPNGNGVWAYEIVAGLNKNADHRRQTQAPPVCKR